LINIIYTSESVSHLLDSDYVLCCYLLHFFIHFFYLLPDIFFLKDADASVARWIAGVVDKIVHSANYGGMAENVAEKVKSVLIFAWITFLLLLYT
jgi:hypothetical protein